MASSLDLKHDEWTWDDLVDLPEGQRYEIVDGALVVTPPPLLPHEVAVGRLIQLLGAALPGGLLVLPSNAAVRYGRTWRLPDVQVVRREAVLRQPAYLEPSDVLLVVEVLSPTSLTTDRVTKRHEYAEAGIPSYWLVDPAVPSLTVLSGPDEGLSAIGDGLLSLTAPYPLQMRPSDLLP